MKDRVPLYPGRVKLTPVSGQENTYDMVRADEPTQEGTPLNKATLLSDEVAAAIAEMSGADAPVTPNEAFSSLREMIANGAKIETGSYVGTGTYGSSNPNSLTFDFTPKFVIVTGVKFVGGTLTSIIPSNSYWSGCFIWIAGMVSTYVGDSNKTMEFGQSENTLSWYTNGTSAGNQCNTLNDTYAYIAIG